MTENNSISVIFPTYNSDSYVEQTLSSLLNQSISPDEIIFSVDGKEYYTYSPEDKTDINWPYDSPQFIILNVAMGGSLGGEIPDDFSESAMHIDYVRVYR